MQFLSIGDSYVNLFFTLFNLGSCN